MYACTVFCITSKICLISAWIRNLVFEKFRAIFSSWSVEGFVNEEKLKLFFVLKNIKFDQIFDFDINIPHHILDKISHFAASGEWETSTSTVEKIFGWINFVSVESKITKWRLLPTSLRFRKEINICGKNSNKITGNGMVFGSLIMKLKTGIYYAKFEIKKFSPYG